MKTKLTLFVTVLAFCFQQSSIGADLKKGLVAYYPFNENSLDESGNGYHAAVSGATFAPDKNGKKNSAYRFDGEDDYMEVKSIRFKDFRNCTLSAWAHYTTLPKEYGQIVSLNGDCHFICVDGPRKQIYMRHGCRTTGAEFYDAPASDKWRHFTLSWDHSTKAVRYFINGKKVGEHKIYAEHGVNQAHLTIGMNGTPGLSQLFKGSIDDVRLYNRALSEAEVKALYDLEKPKGK